MTVRNPQLTILSTVCMEGLAMGQRLFAFQLRNGICTRTMALLSVHTHIQSSVDVHSRRCTCFLWDMNDRMSFHKIMKCNCFCSFHVFQFSINDEWRGGGFKRMRLVLFIFISPILLDYKKNDKTFWYPITVKAHALSLCINIPSHCYEFPLSLLSNTCLHVEFKRKVLDIRFY